jgi:hemerythrin-like domain-containing protein
METTMNNGQSENPVNVLRAEHQVILRVVRVLAKLMDRFEQAGEFAEAPLAKCVEFIRLFADACHHGKEEDLLFPVLESRGIPRDQGPIGVMLHEHQVARGLTRQMADALAAMRNGDDQAKARFVSPARQYVDLLTDHIYKEDNILFTMGDRMMNPGDQRTLTTQFCAVNCRAFEGRRREELQQIADELEAECGHG